MFARLFLLFIIIPIVDLFLLVEIAQRTGIPFTIGLVVLTAAIGAWLVRLQGTEVRKQLMQQFSNQQNPAGLLTDGAMIMLAAGLLLTPGLTDRLLWIYLADTGLSQVLQEPAGEVVQEKFQSAGSYS